MTRPRRLTVPRLLTVVGTRPQLIKYAALTGPLRAAFDEVLVDTGQHYDAALAGDFFAELGLPTPDHTLATRAAHVPAQLGRMLEGLGDLITQVRPDVVLCLGDTTSTAAAALAAHTLGVPLAHLEAGERNHRADGTRTPVRAQPEEANRVLADQLATLKLCVSTRALANLQAEGLGDGAVHTGDILYDLYRARRAADLASATLPASLGLAPGTYHFATCHRALNTDDPARLGALVKALGALGLPVVWPLHPRTHKMLDRFGFLAEAQRTLHLLPPVGHADALALGAHARRILTDSGGVVREAYFHGVPAVILDDSTAWIDLVESGWAVLAGADPARIQAAVDRPSPTHQPPFFGAGDAVPRTVAALQGLFA